MFFFFFCDTPAYCTCKEQISLSQGTDLCNLVSRKLSDLKFEVSYSFNRLKHACALTSLRCINLYIAYLRQYPQS